MSNDTGMNMDTATVTMEHDIVYLYGTFHQGDELQFIDYSHGRQCVANSVSAIALSKIYPIREWKTQHLDQILKAGDVLYQQIHPVEFFDQHALDNGLLELDDIPCECHIFSRQFEIQNIGSLHCDINVTEIGDCLHDMCQDPLACDAIIVMGDQYGAYAASLIQHNGKLYIFDLHSLSHITGMPCAGGTSVLLVFDNVSKCAEYLVQCATSRHAIQLSMWKLVITKMQQYQCGDKVFKYKIKTPQINSAHPVIFSKKEDESTTMQEETVITYKCSRILDNQENFSSHEKACKKEYINVKKLNDRKKREQQKSAQLKSKYLTITSEETIVTDKLKHANYKIKDRQYEILKLQKQMDAHEKKNKLQKKYAYLRTQVSGLQEQIGKLETLVQGLTDRKNELHKQKKIIEINQQFFGKDTSQDETVILDTSKLSNVVRSQQTEHQNLRKRPCPEIKIQINQSSQCNDNTSTKLHAKQSRHSKCQVNEFDDSTYREYRKFKKREHMKQKRLSNEYRQKENAKQRDRDAQRCSSTDCREKVNLKQRGRDAQRRSSTEFKEKENLKQRERNAHRCSSAEFREKENLKQRQRDAQRRSSTEFREKENLKQRQRDAQRHLSTEFREKENLKQRERNAQRRSSTEFREKENLKQRERNAHRCSSAEFKEKENLKQKEHNAHRRSSAEFREKENLKQRERNAHRRSSAEFREKENLKQKKNISLKHKSSEFKDNENNREKYRKAQKRVSEEFRDEENANRQARTQVNMYGKNLLDSIQIFLDAVSKGPIYVCSSCLQTHFVDSVVDVSTLHPGKHQPLLEKCLTQYKSIDEKEWLCLSCKQEIYDGLVPKLSQINKVGFPVKPSELELNRLEEFFIAPLSAFMTIQSIPVCGLVSAGQKLLIGNVVHVANDVGTTVSTLPRMLDDMDTVAVRIKRKKPYKTAVFAENVRPLKVVKALEYLIKNSEMYKSYNFQVPEKWLNHVENSMHDNHYYVEGKYPPATEEESILMEDDNVTNKQVEEVSSAEMTQGNMDTMLTENVPNITHLCDQEINQDNFDLSNKILTLAPGEGKIPVFKDPLAEYLAFPTKFCGQMRPSNSERIRNVHTSEIFKAELKHKDKRVCLDPANIFWKAKHLQIQKFASKVTLALHRVVGSKQQNITAQTLLDNKQ